MQCKQCGSEIKDNSNFCTNCGYSLKGIKFSKLNEYKIPIIIICVFVVTICLILGIKAINSKKSDEEKPTSITENTINNNVIEQDNEIVYSKFNLNINEMTKFIDDIDTELKKNGDLKLLTSNWNYTKRSEKPYYDLAIKEYYTNDKKGIAAIGIVYDNNEIIGINFTGEDTSIILENYGQEIFTYYMQIMTNVAYYLRELVNDEELTQYLVDKITTSVQENKLYINESKKGIKFSAGKNRSGFTTLEYGLENYINEYKEKAEDTATDLLEQIREIDPNNEHLVCYNDYGEYWLLNSEGKKVYFEDIEGYKNAIKICKDKSDSTSENNKDSNTNKQNTITSNNTSNKNNSDLDPSTTHFIAYGTGYPLEDYIDDLNEWGIKYKVIKEENLNFENNVVTKIEPNDCNIDKNTVVTFTVSDNTYNMNVKVDVFYLLRLAGISNDNYTEYYDYAQGKNVGTPVKLLLKINGETIYNGNIECQSILHAQPIGKVKGKPTDKYDIQVIIEGVTIVEKINYFTKCYTNKQTFEICEDPEYGAG